MGAVIGCDVVGVELNEERPCWMLFVGLRFGQWARLAGYAGERRLMFFNNWEEAQRSIYGAYLAVVAGMYVKYGL